MKVNIGIDLMGGDHSPFLIWEVLTDIVRDTNWLDQVDFTVFATEEVGERILGCSTCENLPTLVLANSVVTMEDSLLAAIRKKSSSMSLGLDYLQEDKLDGFISTGNTAALITLSRKKIPVFPAIRRPALLVRIPTMRGSSVILDVGANVSVNPQEMVDFARMGLAYRQCLSEVETPTLGLLNIGSEERKGTEAHRQTFRLLRDAFGARFLGNVESGDVFCGAVDIVVTDGFTGNIFLKTAEGVFNILRNKLESEVTRQMDCTIYPGSMVCGLSKLVIKCHGKACRRTLFNGISGAIKLARARVCQRILSALV